jgi:hypothetical protein
VIVIVAPGSSTVGFALRTGVICPQWASFCAVVRGSG